MSMSIDPPTWPVAGTPVGPGTHLRVVYALAGPIQPGSNWIVSVTSPDNEQIATRQIIPFDGVVGAALTFNLQIGAVHDNALADSDPTWMPQLGDSVKLQVSFDEPTGQLGHVEQLQTWDASSQIQQEIGDVSQGQGGLTDEEKAQLDAIFQGTARTFEVAGISVTSPISDLITRPLSDLLHLFADPIVFTGPGTIDEGQLTVRLAFGVWWEFIEVPPQLGRAERTQLHYQQTVVELRAFERLANQVAATSITQWHTDRVIWWFPFLPMHHIDVWLFPGVTANFHLVTLF